MASYTRYEKYVFNIATPLQECSSINAAGSKISSTGTYDTIQGMKQFRPLQIQASQKSQEKQTS